MGISRATASKWVNRHREFGDIGLLDRSSAPRRSPTATAGDVVELIEGMRRGHKWSTARITFELEQVGVQISRRTVSRILLSLQGDRDLVTLGHSAAVAAALPNGRLAVLPGTHGLPAESPETVNPLLLAFLKRE